MRFSNLVDTGIALIFAPLLLLAGILGLRWYAEVFSNPGPFFETMMGFFAVLALAGVVVGAPIGFTMIIYSVVRSARSSEQRQRYEASNTTTTM